MNEFILGFIVISIAFMCLSIGLILRNQPIKGSCGGIANLNDGSTCDICGRSDTSNCN